MLRPASSRQRDDRRDQAEDQSGFARQQLNEHSQACHGIVLDETRREMG
jgi:hypothetical protein